MGILALPALIIFTVGISGAEASDTEGVALSKSLLQMECGSNDTLWATTLAGETITNIYWHCDDEAIATIDNGIVKALGVGTATISIVSADGNYRAACTINVREAGTPLVDHSLPLGMPQGMGGQGRPIMPRRQGDGEGDRQMPQGMPQGMGGFGGQGMPQGMGSQNGGGPSGPGMGGFNKSDESTATDPNGYVQTEGENSIAGVAYSSSTTDANAVKVSGGVLNITDCTLMKDGGDSSNPDGSSFYGLNSAVLASKEGTININGGFISTNAIGANGIVAYGGTVNVSNVSISCENRLSRGIHATGKGTINAHDLNITTQGANSSVIALDRGGGSVNVFGGNYTCAGRDCAVLYSTGELTVNGILGSSVQGEMGVIEGNNYIAINNSDLTSGADLTSRGLMILQSGSGDAGDGLNGIITVAGGSLTMTNQYAPLIEIVTNVTGKVTLDGVKIRVPSGTLMMVDYNKRWRTYGATGVLVLSGKGTNYNGNIVVDNYSAAKVTVNEGVVWEGAYDNADSAKETTLEINGGTWRLTADSHVDNITVRNGGQIDENGYKLTCDNMEEK